MESESEIPSSTLPAHLEARVEAIIRAAEDHAQNVQRDIRTQQRVAESEAQRHVLAARRQADSHADERMRRLRELTDELSDRAEATLRQFEAFSAALIRATEQLESEGLAQAAPDEALPAAPPAPEPVPPAAAAPAPVARRGRPATRVPPRSAGLDAARLVAIEMAVDGRTRSEVETHLREQFSIEGIEALLDDVFGETQASGRPRWRDGE